MVKKFIDIQKNFKISLLVVTMLSMAMVGMSPSVEATQSEEYMLALAGVGIIGYALCKLADYVFDDTVSVDIKPTVSVSIKPTIKPYTKSCIRSYEELLEYVNWIGRSIAKDALTNYYFAKFQKAVIDDVAKQLSMRPERLQGYSFAISKEKLFDRMQTIYDDIVAAQRAEQAGKVAGFAGKADFQEHVEYLIALFIRSGNLDKDYQKSFERAARNRAHGLISFWSAALPNRRAVYDVICKEYTAFCNAQADAQARKDREHKQQKQAWEVKQKQLESELDRLEGELALLNHQLEKGYTFTTSPYVLIKSVLDKIARVRKKMADHRLERNWAAWNAR